MTKYTLCQWSGTHPTRRYICNIVNTVRRRSLIVEATGRIPVGARQSVRADFLEGRDAAQRGDIATRDRFARGLSVFARQHGYQAVAGLGFAGVNAYYAARHGSGIVAAEAVYDGLYGCINGTSSSIQRLSTSEAFSCASSNVFPNVTQPGKSGNETS